jgi:hypothetical protein
VHLLCSEVRFTAVNLLRKATWNSLSVVNRHRTTTASRNYRWMLVAFSLISLFGVALRNGVFDNFGMSRIELHSVLSVRVSYMDDICITYVEGGRRDYTNFSYQWIGDAWVPLASLDTLHSTCKSYCARKMS